MRIFATFILALCLSVPGLSWAAFHATNPKLATLAKDQRPKKVLILPPQMFVAEMSAGGVIQKQDDWTKQANENLIAATESYSRQNHRFETLRMPALTAEENEIVESHIGLYDRVAAAAYTYGPGSNTGWEQKKNEWDYTLGEGLSFLREKTGADTALIFVGADIISTGGRKAAFVVGAVLGVVIPMGQSFITAGLVDLNTGVIHWLSYDQSMSMDSREADQVLGLVRDFFATYPLQ